LAGAKARQPANQLKESFMLYTLAVILIILWLLGLVTGTAGSLIHVLLLLAIVAVLLRVISGRKPVL
jgi:Family of unknown function (DUF5670)